MGVASGTGIVILLEHLTLPAVILYSLHFYCSFYLFFLFDVISLIFGNQFNVWYLHIEHYFTVDTIFQSLCFLSGFPWYMVSAYKEATEPRVPLGKVAAITVKVVRVSAWLGYSLWNVYVTDDHGYLPLVLVTIPSFSQSCHTVLWSVFWTIVCLFILLCWSLYWLPFLDLQLLVIHMLSSNFSGCSEVILLASNYKLKNKKCHTDGTAEKFNRTIA